MREPTRPISAPSRWMRSTAASLHDLPPPWTVELFENCEGDWSVILMTPDFDDVTYVVTEAASGLRLDELRGDELKPVGEHLDLDACISTIRDHLPRPAFAGNAA